MNKILTLESVSKSFTIGSHSIDVIKDITLELNIGESIAITGPSGAGKSTLIHIMGGLEKPTSGTVSYKGGNIYDLSQKQLDNFRNNAVGFVFQFHYLLDDFTALENVAMPALLKGVSKEAAHEHAYKLLLEMGLADRIKHYPKELSGGEQQRVALARALTNSPSIILADEPTGSLDRHNSDIVRDILFGFVKESASLVIVTHDIELANIADRVTHLEKE
jgi:lipoprotein-releasing system ATP-binding protein